MVGGSVKALDFGAAFMSLEVFTERCARAMECLLTLRRMTANLTSG